ncbi:MAG: DUF4252 domain-containing protein [Planctomycetes bacterium]|nr:DUF4252 domain-containing protein [Planctomycetota bacterium]
MASTHSWLLGLVSVIGFAFPAIAADSKDDHPPGWVDGSSLLKLADDEDVRVEVSLKGPLLKLISSAVGDDDAEVKDLVAGLESIDVLVVGLAEKSRASAGEAIRKMSDSLKKKGWDTLARVHEEDTNVSVLINTTNKEIRGLVVLVVDEDEGELVFVNIVGTIDLDKLAKVSGDLDIPGLGDALHQQLGEGHGKKGDGKEKQKARKDHAKHDETENVR